ncbi:hypothetical protein bthur0005_23760 [Bacillus thuringiensis serovar pakistani str. T13001]|uniref:Uncharacterized protein n=1 Tax=Bacillus cereus VD154 TaxID=1053238 RepID=A0A9W5L4T6_BACCE|nr:hypothetical protein bthur0005_23760 [Bacillus thuringiensis serovar pakistani str. T13001]EJR77035.1 hypothetical protein IK5_00572 [Bacillus cereus VD154]
MFESIDNKPKNTIKVNKNEVIPKYSLINLAFIGKINNTDYTINE